MSEKTRTTIVDVASWPWRAVVEAHVALDAVEAIEEIHRERAEAARGR